MKIGLLHPGAMGVSVGLALVESGHEVVWCAGGRSQATQQRAAKFTPVDDLATLCNEVENIISICPPEFAVTVARDVHTLGFGGIYVDANAVSPQAAGTIAQIFGEQYVDGGIVGPPAHKEGTTRLYLSGKRSNTVANWFSAGMVGVVVIDGEGAQASALKMAYAAYTKGSAALLLAVNALAELPSPLYPGQYVDYL